MSLSYCVVCLLLNIPPPPRSTRTDPLLPSTTLCRSSPDAILIAADRETELAASSLTMRNRVIVVRPRTSVENDADLTLQTPSSECFGMALDRKSTRLNSSH